MGFTPLSINREFKCGKKRCKKTFSDFRERSVRPDRLVQVMSLESAPHGCLKMEKKNGCYGVEKSEFPRHLWLTVVDVCLKLTGLKLFVVSKSVF